MLIQSVWLSNHSFVRTSFEYKAIAIKDIRPYKKYMILINNLDLINEISFEKCTVVPEW